MASANNGSVYWSLEFQLNKDVKAGDAETHPEVADLVHRVIQRGQR